jgi:hypothetical protein
MFKFILTFNFSNHASIIGFHLGFLEIWLHWNNNIYIDDYIVDVIMRATSTFVNLKFHSLIEIIF